MEEYLECRYAQNTVVAERRASAGLKTKGQKFSSGYDEFDSDHMEVPPSYVGVHRFTSTGKVGPTSVTLGDGKSQFPSASRILRPFSPSWTGSARLLSSEVGDHLPDDSPRRLIDGASPSRPILDYGCGRAIVREGKNRGRKRKDFRDDYHNQQEISLFADKFINGNERQTPRALIKAYGHDRGQGISNRKTAPVERMDLNGMVNEVNSRSWQTTEEEEFDWEDMGSTLADRNRNNEFLLSSRARPVALESNSSCSHATQTQLHVDDSLAIPGNTVTSLSSGRGSNQVLDSHYPQEAWNSSYRFTQSSHNLCAEGRGRDFKKPFQVSGISPLGVEKTVPVIGKLPDAGSQFIRPPAVLPRTGSSSGIDSVSVGSRPPILPSSTAVWPPVMIQGLNEHSYIPGQCPAMHLESQLQATLSQPHFPPQQLRGNFLSSATPLTPHLLAPSLNHGCTPKMHSAITIAQSNSLSVAQPPLPVLNMSTGSLPALPPGPPLASQMFPTTQNSGPSLSSQPQIGAFSGLISSLLAQGLISLTNATPTQDPVGLDFNVDLLKVRHESAISALYSDLPRQCTTCGLRFKFQEEHSSHMDWHVTKNRMSKNRKQKPSQKWFVSASMWLSVAEALGNVSVPGFLPTGNIIEKKDNEELAVPADYDQIGCFICGDPFVDFYSDETEGWMYAAAVYMNALDGSFEGMDKQLGPIVHAKCGLDSGAVLAKDFVQHDGGDSEDSSRRKRLRN